MKLQHININESSRIKKEILAQLLRTLEKAGAESSLPVIVRAEVAVEGLDTLTWLCAQQKPSRGYWSDRGNRFELAGSGGADVITGDGSVDYHVLMETLHDRIASAHGSVRYFGGLRFSIDDTREEAWHRFQAYRFVLPRFEVVTRNGTTTFACNMLTSENLETVETELSHLVFPDTHLDGRLGAPLSRHDLPDEGGWRKNVEAALNAFEPGKYEKVVLARKATLEFNQPLDAAFLLQALKATTPQCFHFCFQPSWGTAFVGASPERLYRRDGNLIRTEAIAGSRPRGASPEEDQALSRQLISSEKELREHRYVAQTIHETLTRLCSVSEALDKPSLLKLERCQHLISTFRGKLRAGVKDADLLQQFHPTPAVGGWPTERALLDIARLEPFDRGWYAGPVGWIGKDAAQFVVGIRSGLIENSLLHLFSGAGIVTGSMPQGEWDEIENKISDFLSVFKPA
ncbi:MAG: isochorismate synthase [Deltaproteobacteria bacterium]|nr:isochorismate synthase [Deltaproteobacteria bacterium]